MRLAILETDRQSPDQLPRFGTLTEMMARWLAPAVPGLQATRLDATTLDATAFDVSGGLPEPAGFDGAVITGSRASAYDPEPWIAPLEAWLRAAMQAGTPLLGVCFGHQILAQALGGQVARRGWRVGLTRLHATWPGAVQEPLCGHVWHQDQVTRPPAGAAVLAAYPGCPLGALGYGRRALSVQWHPEYPADYMAAVLAAEGPACLPDPIHRAATASLTGAHDGPQVAMAAAQYLGWR